MNWGRRRRPPLLPETSRILKKSASGVPCLRRASFAEVATEAESGYAQAGRPFVVLTYSSVRSARPSGFGLAGQAFLNTLGIVVWSIAL